MSEQAPPPPAPLPTTSNNAVIALVLSIASWILCPIILAIVALVLARSSDKEIAASEGRLTGTGLNTASRIISWLNIGFTIVAGLVVAVLTIFSIGFFATVASDLNPEINERTGLADGTYQMNPGRIAYINDTCSFGGSVFDANQVEVADTAVYGQGPVQCPDLVDVSVVNFEVTNGVARIISVQ